MPTFKVEDGTGYTDATSFCSVAVADDYCEDHPFETSWSGLSQDQKERLLMWATRLICLLWQFSGYKNQDTQALEIPRSRMYDARNRYLILNNVVPLDIQYAAAEFARLLRAKDRTKDPTRGIESFTVGPITVDLNPDQEEMVLPDSVQAFLKPYGESSERTTTLAIVRT